MLKRRHSLVFGVMTAVLLLAVLWGREVRSMQNYTDPAGPRFVGEFAPPPPFFDGVLTVVTWNIRYGLAVETAVTELKNNPTLHNADILLLQEMDETGVAAMAQELGYNYVTYPMSVHSYHGRNFGNAILSKWPIVTDGKLLLPHRNPSNEQRRNAVYATISVAGQEIEVYSVHTETAWLPAGMRQAQAQAIVDDIMARSEANRVIIGGDFNTITDADGTDLAQLMAAGGLEPVSAGASVLVAGLPISADHLFARGFTPVDNGVYSETKASDHFPVWAQVQFQEDNGGIDVD